MIYGILINFHFFANFTGELLITLDFLYKMYNNMLRIYRNFYLLTNYYHEKHKRYWMNWFNREIEIPKPIRETISSR